MRRAALALAGAVLVLLTGCVRGASDDASASAPEGPVPDEALFRQVAGLPGVATADLRYQHPFGNPAAYAGEITIEEGADPVCVLDEALSVLHQGRPGVELGVRVTSGGRMYDLLSLVGRDGSAEGRYGPQPTEPQPTATVRACTPPDEASSLGGATPTP